MAARKGNFAGADSGGLGRNLFDQSTAVRCSLARLITVTALVATAVLVTPRKVDS